MKTALYARVSTLNGQDPEMQLRELREYATRREWEIADEYTDHGFSGSRDSRPALNRLMADACHRRFDAVLVWKVDRFGRSLRHLVNALAELGALGVAFVSLRDNLDLSTPSGRLMFAVIGAMADYAVCVIMESQSAELALWLGFLGVGAPHNNKLSYPVSVEDTRASFHQLRLKHA